MKELEAGSGAPAGVPEPVDELFYHDGSWYLYKPGPPSELPPFEFEVPDFRLAREAQWLAGLVARSPGPLIFPGF